MNDGQRRCELYMTVEKGARVFKPHGVTQMAGTVPATSLTVCYRRA